MRVMSGSSETVLGKGDSASYRADVPHSISTVGTGQALAFLVVIYR